MNGTRREFIRRLIAASALAVTGVVGALGLMAKETVIQPQESPAHTQQPSTTTQESRPAQQTSTSTPTLQSTDVRTTQTGSTQASQSSTNLTTQSTTSVVPNGYILVTAVSALAGRNSAYFNHPNFGTSLLLNLNGEWKAFNAACTHAGCTVQFASPSIYCPCHAGYFSPSNGAFQGGPPTTALPEYGVLIQDNNLYVSSQTIN